MRKISPAEFALAAALFAVSGVTAVADNFIRQSDQPAPTTIAQAERAPAPAPASQDSDR